MKKKRIPKYAIGGNTDPNAFQINDPRLSGNADNISSQLSLGQNNQIVQNPYLVDNGTSITNTNSGVTNYKIQDENKTNFSVSPNTQPQKQKGSFNINDINFLAQGITGLANGINNARTKRQDQEKYIQSLQQPFRQNNTVVNNLPTYTKMGGKGAPQQQNQLQQVAEGVAKMLQQGAQPQQILAQLVKSGVPQQQATQLIQQVAQHMQQHPQQQSQQLQQQPQQQPQQQQGGNLKKMPYGGGPLNSTGAKEILKDGTIHGKALTPAQKKYFGFIAGGGKPSKAKYGFAQDGGDIPQTNGLPSSEENQANVEAEKGEAFKNYLGEIAKVSDTAPTHEEGGVLLPNVEKVLENTSSLRRDKASKALRITPETFKGMYGVNTKKTLSHSEALEELDKHYQNQADKYGVDIQNTLDILQDTPNDLFAKNSLNENLQTLKNLPTRQDLFDHLFSHQEDIKNMMGINQNQQAKCGGKYLPKADSGYDDELIPYKGGIQKTPTGNNNAFNYQGGIGQYKKDWSDILGEDVRNLDNKTVQAKSYDYLLQTPEGRNQLREMWNSNQNTRNGNVPKNIKWDDLSDNDLRNLKANYTDNKLGLRSLAPVKLDPSIDRVTDSNTDYTPDEETPDNTPAGSSPSTPSNATGIKSSQSPSTFNDPLRWYNIAGDVMNLAGNERIPTNYNPAQFSQIKLKLLNPTPSLEQGKRDYNAVLGTLPSNGTGMANGVNAFSQKYNIDNQILSQYENQNVGIRNQEEEYNANAADRQSASDQQSRENFERKYLGSLEAQRQNKLNAWNDIFNKIALNHKQNTEGNLLMKMFPNFNQQGNYNGNERYFTGNTSGNTIGSGGINNKNPQLAQLLTSFNQLNQQGKIQVAKIVNSGLYRDEKLGNNQ